MEKPYSIQNNPNHDTDAIDDNLSDSGECISDHDSDVATLSLTQQEYREALCDAEQRGYIRGRNEAIETKFISDTAKLAETADCDPDDEPFPTFLSHLRPGFWD